MEDHTQRMQPVQPAPQQLAPASQKNYAAALLMSMIFGGYGVDRFYMGYIGTGILKLLTGGGFGIWALIDVYRIAFGKLGDADGNALAGYAENSRPVQKVVKAYFVIVAIAFVVGIFVGITVIAAVHNLPSYN